MWQDLGASKACCQKEAYILWLFFGPVGAHRYYCGQRDMMLWMYGCTLGLGGIGWLADAALLPGLVATHNRRGDAGAKGLMHLRHVELNDLSERQLAPGVYHDAPNPHTQDTADMSTIAKSNKEQQQEVEINPIETQVSNAWNSVIQKAHQRATPTHTLTPTHPHPPTDTGDSNTKTRHQDSDVTLEFPAPVTNTATLPAAAAATAAAGDANSNAWSLHEPSGGGGGGSKRLPLSDDNVA